MGDKSDPNMRMPREDAQTFFFRVQHDRQSLKGGGERPFIKPAAEKTFNNFDDITRRRLEKFMELTS